VLIKLLTQWKLFDTPGHHKIHSSFKPSLGGVAVMVGATLALLLGLPMNDWMVNKYFFISLTLMFMIGLRDDVLALTPKQKLYSQFLPVFLLVFLNNTTLNSTYGIVDLPEIPSIIIWAISAFTLIILTNAYNLIDGLDGLAGSIGVIILAAFGFWFYYAGNEAISLVAFCFGGALLAFLFFNWQPSKIFMGDTGALMIGMLVSYLAILFINTNAQLPLEHAAKMQASIGSAICIVIIPVFDTLRVIILRLIKMQSPFKADKNHLHHQFLNLGYSHSQAVLFISFLNLFVIVLGWLLRKQNDLLILGIIAALCLLVNYILRIAQQRMTKTHGIKSKIN
jgi:UDP-N-acetylmuramyl pentapeptide phosphotransferase/UDP-N-acetylglucosamine-1-phosphate transferase